MTNSASEGQELYNQYRAADAWSPEERVYAGLLWDWFLANASQIFGALTPYIKSENYYAQIIEQAKVQFKSDFAKHANETRGIGK